MGTSPCPCRGGVVSGVLVWAYNCIRQGQILRRRHVDVIEARQCSQEEHMGWKKMDLQQRKIDQIGTWYTFDKKDVYKRITLHNQ